MTIEAFAEATSSAALRAIVTLKADWFRAANKSERERVLAAMRDAAIPAIEEAMRDARELPAMADIIARTSVATIVAAGVTAITTGAAA